MANLFQELKRRNVFRAAAAYIVGGWLLVEVFQVLIEVYEAPDWILKLFVSLLVIGLPVVMAFSWAFEITPEGVRRDEDVDHDLPGAHATARRLDAVTIGLLVVAVAFVGYDRLLLDESPGSSEPATQPSEERPPDPEDTVESVAVLPFTNLSGDPSQEHIADGLSDTLIHVLGQVSGLKVTAKTSSFAFKGKNVDVRRIADELDVGAILEGSIQRAGNRVRVIAQLVHAEQGTQLWSANFDRELVDIFAIQDEIAQEVVEALEIALLDSERQRLKQRYEPTLEAFGELVLGRQANDRRTVDSLAAAERHFQAAIELDPDYALAYVGLVDTYNLQRVYGGLTMAASLERRLPLIQRALELDPLSGEALTSRAQYYDDRREFEAAESDFLRAIELSPNYATAHQWYAVLLREQGRFEDSLEQARMAATLDPIAPIRQISVAAGAWNLGRVEEAMAIIHANIERHPDFPVSYSWLAAFHTALGELQAAQGWIEAALERSPDSAIFRQQQCYGHLNLGDLDSARECLQRLESTHPNKFQAANVRLGLQMFVSDWDGARVTLESMRDRFPYRRSLNRLLADVSARQGDLDRGYALMAAAAEHLESGKPLAPMDLFDALVLASILDARSEIERRNALLTAMEAAMSVLHRTRGPGFGAIDVYVLAMRGDDDGAISALRQAVSDGWRARSVWSTQNFQTDPPWWIVRDDWKLKQLRQHPDFIPLLSGL